MAAQCAPGGRVVATDVRPRRVALLHETMARCHPGNVAVVHIAEDGPLPFPDGVFDRVLVDAPCSGLGTVRRDPDIRWRRQPEDLQRFAAAQLHLLTRISRHVAPGGRVVYSTCSSEPEENDDVVADFLATATAFRHVPLDSIDGLPDRVTSLAGSEGYLKTTPLDSLEGFFGAVLERRL
jgi:16S rRNA (cytosine967-C5)-methyltransferase